MRARAAALVLLGCGDAASIKGTTPQARDFAGATGTLFEYASAEAPDEVPLALLQTEGGWETRMGDDWDDATPVASYTYTVAGPILVDGVELLPAEPAANAPCTVYYGTFSDCASAEVPDITFAGTWTFARDIGPVRTSFAGVARELVYYEYGALDTGTSGQDTGDSGEGGPRPKP